MSRASSFEADLRCPDDGHLLREHPDARVPFASCRHCDGLWITREALDKGGALVVPPVRDTVRASRRLNATRACPRCTIKLDAVTVDQTVIDVCPSCGGVWLDPGDYQAARRRSVRQRIERDVPAFKPSSSKIGRFMSEIVDLIGDGLSEEPPDAFDPRSLFPWKGRRN